MPSWADPIYRYCERGGDAAFWAEPFNALTNAAYLLAAGLAAHELRRAPAPPPGKPGTATLWLLVVLTAAIGAGSFLFHTFASRWARLADVVPIGLFMLVYLVLALRTLLGLGGRTVAALVAGFLAVSLVAARISCPQVDASLGAFAREPCLKGSLGYLPALVALLVVGVAVHRRHPAARGLLVAAGVFGLAILFRWMDTRACSATVLMGRPRGTHAGWHLLTALTLYLLLRAAMRAAPAHATPSASPRRGDGAR